MNEGNTFKDKDQSIYEFYETLQIEYLVCELRRKIYPRDKDKRYYRKTALHKENKIIDISERNHLPSIFNDEALKKSLINKIYGDFGLPNFTYRNGVEKKELQPKDVYYYYNSGVEVRVKTDDGIKVGIISQGIDAEWKNVEGSQYKQLVISDDEVIKVKFRGEEEDSVTLTSRASRVM